MRYAIIENGIVVNIAEAEFPLADNWIAGETANRGDTYVDGTFIPSEPEPEPEPEPTWKITKLAFKNRFPRAKWIAARQAALSDTMLFDFFESFDLATYIDLERQDTRDAVLALSTESVPVAMRLTQEEVTAAIDAPATQEELPSHV